jgi:hypothetical protein
VRISGFFLVLSADMTAIARSSLSRSKQHYSIFMFSCRPLANRGAPPFLCPHRS